MSYNDFMGVETGIGAAKTTEIVLRFTDGAHVEPDRNEIIEALLEIADEEMAFLVGAPVE